MRFISKKIQTRAAFVVGMIALTGMICFMAVHTVQADSGRTVERAEGVRKKAAAVGRTDFAEENEPGEKAETDRNSNGETTAEVAAPTKEEVLAARERVLEGMSREEIENLKENIKVANQQMESAYLNDNIFKKLEDKESLYWNYFDEKGEIQIGWAYDGSYLEVLAGMEKENISREEFYARYGTPVMDTNRFHAENFMEFFAEMKETVKDEKLREDLQQIIDETALAVENHEVEHVLNIYRLLHDMDYYLLRYGPEDVGKYVRDTSLIDRYYGVLSVYEQ